MHSYLRAALILMFLTVLSASNADAQEGLTKRDRRGPVTVEVNLIAPAATGEPFRAKVVLDTHSVALDGIKFEEAVALRAPDGIDIAPMAVEQATGGGHHREAVLVFPAVAGAGPIRILVRNVGGVAERSFSWDLPAAR